MFSTDPPLGKPSKYTVLADPKHVTGFQNVAPIVKTSVATGSRAEVHEHGERGLGEADAARDRRDEQGVHTSTSSRPAAIAKAFLQANGLA